MKTLNILSVIIGIIFITIIFTACPDNPFRYKYDTGVFPQEVVNIKSINTRYDDYNMSSPYISSEFPLCFSSNRNSRGKNFDIIYKLINISFSRETAELKIAEDYSVNPNIKSNFAYISELVKKVNTDNNEYGPYIRSFIFDQNLNDYYSALYNGNDSLYRQSLLMFATEKNGNLDIEFVHNIAGENLEKSIPVSFINTENNEAYPTFNEGFTKILYCSDESGNYDIYSVPFDNTKKIEVALADSTEKEKSIITALSSSDDDKCPYTEQNFIVFTSNRPGGFGGFDLYYSIYENGKWGEPINLGERINTEYDEYRPVLKYVYGFENNLLLFSSNRPGGIGGFDLYYTGIDLIK